MAKNKSSCCGGDTKVVLACAGASNVGQMGNEVAKKLDSEGTAGYFCLAGVGGHVSGMMASVRGANRVLVIDGCPVGCGKKCMEGADISGYEYLVLTEIGIEKKHVFDLPDAEMEKAMAAARQKLSVEKGCCGG